MFDVLIELYNTDLPRAIAITISLVVIAGLVLWVSIIDIRRKSIAFWKMLIASFSTILGCFVASFFCGCKWLPIFIAAAIPVWIFLLFLNVKYNKDKFVGKADVDLLSALFSLCLCYSGWLLFVTDSSVAAIRITHLWYTFFLYLLIGSLIFIAAFLVYFLIAAVLKKRDVKELFKSVKISVIPMILPAAIMVPYNIMVS